jgi:hypothetical protein
MPFLSIVYPIPCPASPIDRHDKIELRGLKRNHNPRKIPKDPSEYISNGIYQVISLYSTGF